MASTQKESEFPYTDAQLEEAGLMGEGVSAEVREIIAHMREHPDRYHATIALLQSTNEQALAYEALAAARAHPETLSTTTDGAPYAVSEYERIMYYHAQSAKAPALLYRSDLHERPYPLPPASPPPRCPRPFAKRRTAMGGVWNGNKDLYAVWDKMAERGVNWLTIDLFFYNEGGDGEELEGEDEEAKGKVKEGITTRPVIMIHVHPGGATAEAAHAASEEMLAVCEARGVSRGEVAIEWQEGHVRRWGSHGTNYVALQRRRWD